MVPYINIPPRIDMTIAPAVIISLWYKATGNATMSFLLCQEHTKAGNDEKSCKELSQIVICAIVNSDSL